ncbi:DUF6056 family protein [Streptomyces sp. ISL-100]|uniref:DUF6056 family protein n=1 Tax=Streptomyces sp. ISL-100 TaxID=2819173 RepID=UPI001BE5CA99|nr:DUF6056 family protein [Streptomyces sp. ISL-100]MBT2396370.1 hypothetical protein [Streptomyces sp. ISL-100]
MAAGSLLAVGSFLGLSVRFTSDDWCAAWKSRDLGLLGITHDFYETQNGRITNALVTGIVYINGLSGPQHLPLFLVLALLAALTLLARAVLRLFSWEVPFPVVVAAATVLVVLLFFAGPSGYQALLWAPATISHTLPSVLAVWSVLAAFSAARRDSPVGKRLALGSALAMGAAIGTLSEPFTIVSGLFAGAAAVILLFGLRSVRDWFPPGWCLMWCAGLTSGFVLLYTSPGAAWRRTQQPQQRSPLSSTELKATAYDWLHIWENVVAQRAYLAALAVGLMIGLTAVDQRRPTAQKRTRPAAQGSGAETGVSRRRRWLLALLPVLLIGACSFGVAFALRTGYGPTGWTYGRAWTNFLFPMLLLLCAYGVLAGRAIVGRRLSSGLIRPVAFTVAAVASLWAVAGLVPIVQSMAKDTVIRSVDWDRQDLLVRKEVASGSKAVPYRPLRIGGLAEPYMTTNYARDWVAQCVSRYYKVERIRRPAP